MLSPFPLDSHIFGAKESNIHGQFTAVPHKHPVPVIGLTNWLHTIDSLLLFKIITSLLKVAVDYILQLGNAFDSILFMRLPIPVAHQTCTTTNRFLNYY
jgi:hypothetical protein